jgi:two-component system, response regulator, stage 0 sporulation protein F
MDNIITLLYVDDETINLKLFEINFKDKFNVITANSGFVGLEKLKENPSISVVISNMRMPEMNGIEFVRLAREQFPNVTYFMLSGYDITDEIELALKESVINKYFKKPFNMKEIEISINAVLIDS